MPLQPIDLQTLFAHMNQVGREQAALKGAAVAQQEIRGQELAKETLQKDETVQHTDELQEEAAKVREKQQEGGGAHHEEERKRKGEQAEEKRKKHYFEDPALGKNIDISG